MARALGIPQFQIFSAAAGRIALPPPGWAEALLRWHREGQAIASPPDILAVLERIGLMGLSCRAGSSSRLPRCWPHWPTRARVAGSESRC